MHDLSKAKILILGGTGFIGSHLTQLLHLKFPEAKLTTVGRDTNADATLNVFHPNELGRLMNFHHFEYVFNLLGDNGGIAMNMREPFAVFNDNTIMNLTAIEEAGYHKVKKIVSMITSCGYPCINKNIYGDPKDDYEEYQYLEGYPHPTVACHGYARRNVLLASQYIHEEEGISAVCACPTTLYGPGDKFDEYHSKVVGAMIHKIITAKRANVDTVTCWGTGNPKREIMYVEDACRYLIRVMEKYEDHRLPINIGSGQEVSIKELAEQVADVVKYTGTIVWDKSRADGAMRKLLNRNRQTHYLGRIPLMPVVCGIEKTVAWYMENIQ